MSNHGDGPCGWQFNSRLWKNDLNAVNLLNDSEGGRRRCIMVINNEVSEAEAKAVLAKNLLPGDDEWKKHGICHSIT